ncbi:MAG: DinB family protein [Cyclobacteriaceae bacterium]|nr:DinB family protein [Cyclobacteriaceae bacterium]
MKTKNLEAAVGTERGFMTPEAFLQHWQGHRRLTRKVIEAFPEDKLFSYSIGGMRPFSQLAIEMLSMGAPGIRGIVERKWEKFEDIEARVARITTKKELLRQWDEATREIDELWSQLPEERFHETEKVFDTYEGLVYDNILYFIDNEIHHRGQGYVYLRSLGIEPPHFAIRN